MSKCDEEEKTNEKMNVMLRGIVAGAFLTVPKVLGKRRRKARM